jgi:hypothetical protein
MKIETFPCQITFQFVVKISDPFQMLFTFSSLLKMDVSVSFAIFRRERVERIFDFVKLI